ncbi:hypothetical protein [Streptomyces sp. NPDC127197]|uniref:hypothetical protein n=1 Tax=Streptomyces sp. NPDC127197 TaxID=3345388 RepID=UPI003634C75F
MSSPYDEWEIPDPVHRDLEQGLMEGVYGAMADGSIQSVVDAIGKQELILMMAGTTDKKSRAYKSARDKVGRWLKGSRRPSKAGQQLLDSLAKKFKRDQVMARGSLSVSISGTFVTSKKPWKGKMSATLTGTALADFMDALEGGDPMWAAQVVCQEYGMDPDVVLELTEVGEISVS